MAARTSVYSDLQSNIQHLIGTDTLLATEKAAINSYFKSWIRKGWNRANWPDICRVEERTPASSKILYEQGGSIEAIGEFLNIYSADPYANKYPYELSFILNHEGAVLLNASDLTTVFVHYRQRIPDYSAYDGEDSAQTFPYRFFNYVAYGAYSDWLQSEGQHEKARVVASQAEEAMLAELDIFERQQLQQTPTIFTTHTSQQWR